MTRHSPLPVVFWLRNAGGKPLDLNLETLKSEMLDYLAASEFAVFRSHAGGLDHMNVIPWDTERFPDYRMFLDTARKVGQKLILFASRELDEEEVEEALEELEELELSREEQREFESRIREAGRHVGSTCSLEMAFDYNSHLYVYEAQAGLVRGISGSLRRIDRHAPGGRRRCR